MVEKTLLEGSFALVALYLVLRITNLLVRFLADRGKQTESNSHAVTMTLINGIRDTLEGVRVALDNNTQAMHRLETTIGVHENRTKNLEDRMELVELGLHGSGEKTL